MRKGWQQLFDDRQRKAGEERMAEEGGKATREVTSVVNNLSFKTSLRL